MVTTLEPDENIESWNRGACVRISQTKKTRLGVPLAFTYLLLEAKAIVYYVAIYKVVWERRSTMHESHLKFKLRRFFNVAKWNF